MASSTQRTGFLCIVSGPSGSGKTTLCRRAREEESCVYSISCTTRSPREGEADGIDYHFLDRDGFLERTVRGEFLEWARVHGELYGTLRKDVIAHLMEGRDVIMDIDVQGAALVRATDDPFIRKSMVDVFVMPPSMEELGTRLAGRGTESADQLRMRLYNALEEMEHWREYRYAIISGSPEEDFERFRHILRSERQRTARLMTPRELQGECNEGGVPMVREDQSELF